MDAELAINSIWVLSVQKLTFVFYMYHRLVFASEHAS
jgi:hypothetical protein